MPNRAGFQLLANKRFTEAKTLFREKHHEAAFYMAGYAVECGLKAAVCKTLSIDIFDMSDLNKGFKTHRLDHLIVLSGLSKQLVSDAAKDEALSLAQNQFATQPAGVDRWNAWSEESRYNVIDCKPETCKQFLTNVDTFLTWLRNHW